MRRREFIALLGGAATWPLAARATPFASDDAEALSRLTAFAQALAQLGWTVGQNVRIDYRWGPGNAETMRKYAAELLALAPDVILASTSPAVVPLLEASRTVPIVFAAVADPVAAGFVESLARPGGNATGITNLQMEVTAKRLGFLRELLPKAARLAVLVPQVTVS
jgi:putative ABC transport system substrate-binding protein